MRPCKRSCLTLRPLCFSTHPSYVKQTKQAQAGPKTEPAPAGEAPKETETLSSNKMDPFSVGQAASTDSDNKKVGDPKMGLYWALHTIPATGTPTCGGLQLG
jgi:hypothetical protein